MDLVEFSNSDLTRAFNEVVASELLEITNFEWINEIALLAYQMEMPYPKFWASLINIILLNHAEFSLTDQKKSLIDLLYYILKSNHSRSSSE